ncbi:hypothetical protein, partial [Lapillicoccus sp.]|uniref:hypothetical protein n=1 Tax=Lapillicoccus sp. TaxID=1909287 RepID=UPI0025DDF527
EERALRLLGEDDELGVAVTVGSAEHPSPSASSSASVAVSLSYGAGVAKGCHAVAAGPVCLAAHLPGQGQHTTTKARRVCRAV